MRKTLILPAVALALPGFASAADLDTRMRLTQPTPALNWQGFYAGNYVGLGHVKFTSSQTSSRSVSDTGISNGIIAGWSTRSGNFVYGVETSLGLNIIRADNPGGAGLIAHAGDALYSGQLRGRFGYALGDYLPFVAGGASMGEVYMRRAYPLQDSGDTRRVWGWNVGAGVDTQFDLPIIGQAVLRAEYLYEGFPSKSYVYDPTAAPVRMKLNSHYFRAALISTSWGKPARSPATTEAAVWAGPYLGAMTGYGSQRIRNSATGGASATLTADGAYGGLYAGRNFVFGNVVAGIEGSVSIADWKGDGALPGLPGSTINYRDYIEADTRVRLGYAWGRFLPFLAGGMAWGRSEQIDRTTGSERGRVPTHALALGGGLDAMIADRISLRAEYIWQKQLGFGSDDLVYLSGQSIKQERSGNVLRLGVAYHFN